jgi:hypothetical protein
MQNTGLACSLLNIESVEQLSQHYLRGGLFESCVVSELVKQRFNQGATCKIPAESFLALSPIFAMCHKSPTLRSM